jgi:endonuclease III
VLAEGRGERIAARLINKLRAEFVDWNEVRVARPRDLAAAAPEAPEDRVKKMQALLQALYENLGGLDPAPLFEKKPTEARAWLTNLGGLGREEVDAVLMIALGLPVMPGSEHLARIMRRMGVVPRKSTRARAQRTALKGISPEDYREFYSLVGEHAAAVCHAQVPECARCKLKRSCKSKGRW